jgi:hypothetical protein
MKRLAHEAISDERNANGVVSGHHKGFSVSLVRVELQSIKTAL